MHSTYHAPLEEVATRFTLHVGPRPAEMNTVDQGRVGTCLSRTLSRYQCGLYCGHCP